MMNSQSMQTLIDPVFRNKMPLFDGSMASAGLSKPQNMSDLLGKQALQYNGAYFGYDPRGRDGAAFTPPWSNSKASLLDDRSPVTHLPGMDRQGRITCRQDGNSSDEGRSRSSPLCHTQVKQGFTVYTKSPRVSSPTAATTVAVRKQKSGGENLSPSENTVYLAVPKPVYGHSPCCNELGCVIGRRYHVEHGSPRIPHTVYEHDWMQADAHYAETISRKAQDPLLQQRGLPYENSAESIKRMTVERYSPSITRTFPARIEPNYSSYPCTPTHTFFTSLSDQRQRLRTPPKGYPRLYPPHPTYEHMTSEVYQECSPMSKYGQLAQHPVFYYPQANVELENRTQCKDISSKQREDIPVILKHTISNPREHFIVPQSLHGEMPLPLPSAETLPHHSFMRAFDYPCYAIPRFHLNTSQISPPLKTQHVLPSFHSHPINASPSSQHMDHLMASAASLHNDKSNTSLHVDKLHVASPFLCVEQTSSTRHISQSGISPPSIEANRFFPPRTRSHVDQPIPPPADVNMDRLMDYSHCENQVTCPKLLKGLPVSQAAWLPRPPTNSSDHVHTAAANSAKVRKIIYSPAVATGKKRNESASSTGTTLVKGCLKRSTSHSSPQIKIKEEDKDLCEMENIKKRQKVEMDHVRVGNKTESPPMPVIDNVFSLAPYQANLQASGVVFPGRAPLRAAKSPEHHGVKTKSDIKDKRQFQDEQQPVESLVPKESGPDITITDVVDVFEPKTLKVEKVEPSDMDGSGSPLIQNDCSKIIKKEPEQNGSSDNGPMFVIKTFEPDEVESKPSLPDENSDEFKPAKLTAQTNSFSQGDVSTLHEQVVTVQPQSVTPPQPPETKVNFRNIPPQCLKLSTYKIILPDAKAYSPIPPPEKPPAQPITEYVPKLELQMPVRKHFLELHHSLCKLVSKSVSGSSKQKINTWLSHMKLTEPTSSSTKVQKVSCLLGVKAREVWLDEEMESALHKVLERLREYTIQERSPFPHVMRAGAVFIPMLVVKELLFPTVQGSFIDQVLQEHKVELRPTTLSEEKILIQLHKRACSSRLRRLMSLKHLPDIYADVVNLFYYACVCKHFESTSSDVQKRVQD
ncbi:uncharacterized protein C15orf39 homolog [Channa argus]|uniref:uncharacterized protein C15orf39 homolog n=1 Tax=Channa argus TaxID=215402 RepID=UPI0029458CC2|nr:hypothetical protein Q8A73_004554 [Channa argus]